MRVSATVVGIDDAVAEVDSAIHKTARVLVIEVWENLMISTPVDTGRTRANWRVTASGQVPELPDGSYARPPLPVVPRFNELYIINPQRHIQYLNGGSSSQAPALFIEHAMEAAADKVRMTKRLR